MTIINADYILVVSVASTTHYFWMYLLSFGCCCTIGFYKNLYKLISFQFFFLFFFRFSVVQLRFFTAILFLICYFFFTNFWQPTNTYILYAIFLVVLCFCFRVCSISTFVSAKFINCYISIFNTGAKKHKWIC